MKRADRYEIIRPLFLRHDIKTFSELFDHIPASVFAGSLGKPTKRFLQLVSETDQFKIEEIAQMARLCKLSVHEMFKLVQPELTRLYKNHAVPRSRTKTVNTMHEEGKIATFADIFKYVDIKPTAEGAEVNRTRLARSKTTIKKLSFDILMRVGLFYHLTIPEILLLIENEYAKQNPIQYSRIDRTVP
jgi:hypothetical protein